MRLDCDLAKALMARTGRAAWHAAYLSAFTVVLASGACHSSDPCIPLLGPCPTGPGESVDTVRVLGFPPANVSGSVGSIHVAESVALHLIRLDLSPPMDTVRIVTWGLVNASGGVRILGQGDGSAVLSATGTGSLDQVTANGAARSIWSCALNCVKLSRVLAIP